MKPIRLRLAGLHSYREMQEIDFEKLCEAGLFGIFGPTGSGKSTILDAITLSLYGQVVRSGGGSHPKEVLNQLEQRVTVSFTFELGADEKRQRYTVEREFGRNKNGNWKQPEARLIRHAADPEEEDAVLESKATSVTSAVESLIGLTLQDFTRAVVLPQGQFSRFLTLKGSDRNEMLQRMFHLHIYGEKLSERVRAGLDAVRERIHQLELEKAALGEAGPEALEAARQMWEEAAEKERSFAQQRDSMEKTLRQLEQLYRWQGELEEVRVRLSEQLARQEEAAGWERLYGQLEASVRLWPQVEQYDRLDTEWSGKAAELEASRQKQEEVRSAHQLAEEAYLHSQSALQREEPLLIERKSRLIQAIEWEDELQTLRQEWNKLEEEWQGIAQELPLLEMQLSRDKELLARWDQERAELDKALAEVQVKPEWRERIHALRDSKQHWERIETQRRELAGEREAVFTEQTKSAAEREAARLALDESSAALAEVRAKLAELDERPPMSDSEWQELLDTLSHMKQWGRQWREQEQALAAWEEGWRELAAHRELAAARLLHAERALKEAEAALGERQTLREKLRSEWEHYQEANMAKLLRDRLTEGEACPVCGSAHHPWRDEADGEAATVSADSQIGERLRQQIRETEEGIRLAEQQVRAASEAWHQAKGDIAVLDQRASDLQEERSRVDQRIREIRAECKARGELWAAADIGELLQVYQREERRFKEESEKREAFRASREALQKTVEEWREKEAEHRHLLERRTLLCEQQAQRAAELSAKIEEISAQAEEAKRRLDQLRGEIPYEEIDTFWQALGQRDRKASELQKIRSDKEVQHQKLQGAYQEAVTRHTALQSQETILRERLDERKRLWLQKHQQWQERTGGQPAREQLALVERSLEQLRASLGEAEARRKQAAEAREEVQNQVLKLTENYAHLTRQRAEAWEHLNRALAESGLGTVEQAGELYRQREQRELLKERLNQYQSELARLRYDEERLLTALDGRSVSEEEWQAAKLAWEEAESGHQTAKEQVAVSRQAWLTVEQNHEKWVALQARLDEETDEQSRLEELKKLLEGKAFVQFIAEEKLVSIARDASYHLMRMTKNRYALEIGDGGEFVLRDEGAGGMRRPISTLSGGETFLTSLSLALALSMEIQMRGGRLEFFFLDEGFGTLDPELLEVVMDALERLRMDDFTIGVISHVPDIRVRMPRRLIITPAEPMGEGSKIRMETE